MNSSQWYRVYGLTLRSEIPLSLPGCAEGLAPDVQIRAGTPQDFAEAIANGELRSRADWYEYRVLDNGASFVRWSGMGEFIVSRDGAEIRCGAAPEALPESFQVYLLGQALSFALIQRGEEPLHATAVVNDGEAVAFLADSGLGKSTLAACFLDAGDLLLTDDLLILRPGAEGLQAFPGPPRIKLFPDSARHFALGDGDGARMNPATSKTVLPIGASQQCPGPVRLRAMYVIGSPGDESAPRIETLSPRDAFLALVGNSFNIAVVDPERLKRQALANARIVETTPVKKLFYPRALDRLSEVRKVILRDSLTDRRS